MYDLIKLILKVILPAKLFGYWEGSLRQLLYLFHKGSTFTCNICESGLRSFIIHRSESGHVDLICPKCAGLPRQRLLYLYLTKNWNLNSAKLLHFTPNKFMRNKFKSEMGDKYLDSDFETKNCKYQFNILKLPLENQSLDYIICYHILEHIKDDKKAISELFRVLKSKGELIIQVPWKKGATVEFSSVLNEEESIKHYGQKDHVRYYGKDNFIDRLRTAGFHIAERTASEITVNSKRIEEYQLNSEEVVFICTKE